MKLRNQEWHPVNDESGKKIQSRVFSYSFALATAFIFFCVSPTSAGEQKREQVTISNLEELAEYSGKSGNYVRMEPGLYHVTDYYPLEKIPEKNRKLQEISEKTEFYEAGAFINFSGHDNVFDLRGVTIEFDTKLRSKLGRWNNEFLLSGEGNELKGVTIVNTGDGSADGGWAFAVIGKDNTMRNCTLVVRGSNPYGYGGAFGTGDNHNGLRIWNGDNIRILGCNVYMRAFGHGIAIQGGSENTYFKDCYVEGEMRTTDDILAETSGLAYKRDFRIGSNRKGWPGYVGITDEDGKLKPGGILSLAADGYRFYSPGKTTFVNCKVKNMRRGFAVEKGGPAHLENCVAIGNGNAFATGAADEVFVLENCRGDAKYGPLLTSMWGGSPLVELYLLPDESELKSQFHQWGVAGVEKINGGTISIKPWRGEQRQSQNPITLGVNNISTAFTRNLQRHGRSLGEKPVRNLTLENKTTMPVRITNRTEDCKVHTKGEVLKNNGTDIDIEKLEDTDSSE